MQITHVGGPTTLIEVDGWRLLTDPTFDAPGRRYSFGFGTSSRKVAGPAVAAEDLGPVDAVLLSHDHHADNLDDAGRAFLATVPVVVTTGAGARRLSTAGGGPTIGATTGPTGDAPADGGPTGGDPVGSGPTGRDVRGLAPWATTRLEAPGRPAIDVTATPCRHGPPLSRPIVGDVIGFALAWEGQRHGVVWVTGDTVLYDDVRQVPRRLTVGTAILHLGGVRFPITGPLRYSMTAADAVELVELADPHTALPVHFEGWTHFVDGPDAVDAAFAAAPEDVRARVLRPALGAPVEVEA